MAKNNYTEYLSYMGKQVSFIVEDTYYKTRTESVKHIKLFKGTISGVFLHESLPHEFLLKQSDEFFSFSEVTFIKEQKNPHFK